MSRYLFVQTAFAYHEVVLVEDTNLIQVFRSQSAKETVQFLQTTLFTLAKEAFDALVFVSGPGSFTALRVGATWVNTIAFVRKIPVVSINSLQYVSWVQSIPLPQVVVTFDSARHFVVADDYVIASLEIPHQSVSKPDQEMLWFSTKVAAELSSSVAAAVLTKEPQSTDILYVIPPKITQRKS